MALDQLGAYPLIMTQWVNGSIPADLRVLGRLLRNQDADTTERIWMALEPCYRDHAELEGELIQRSRGRGARDGARTVGW